MTERGRALTKINVIGAGLVTVDILQLCTERWVAQTKPVYFSGGTVCNILSHLGAFGWRCLILGGVGSDPFRNVIKEDLKKFGVDISGLVIRENALTRRITHLVVIDGQRRGMHKFMMRCPKCDQEFPPFAVPSHEEFLPLLEQNIDGSTILIIDRVNEFTIELARRVSAAGGVIIFEPGYLSRNEDLVKEMMQYVDLLKYSRELMWKGIPFSDSMPVNHPKLKLTIETRGKRGVIASRRRKEIRLTTTPIMDIVDSAGAGDAFMAGFLTGLGPERLHYLGEVSDADLERALQRGQALGGLACLFVGSKGVLYRNTIEEIEDAIKPIVQNLHPPEEFGSSDLPEGIRLELKSQKSCEICQLPI